MDQKNFDYSSYGLIEKNELSVKLHLSKVTKISAHLEFTNISSRDLHVENRLWYSQLKVLANEKPLTYKGPMVSLPPPAKSDFVTIKPGSKFVTEPAILNSYYGIPEDFKGTLKVSFEFSPNVPMSEDSLAVEK